MLLLGTFNLIVLLRVKVGQNSAKPGSVSQRVVSISREPLAGARNTKFIPDLDEFELYNNTHASVIVGAGESGKSTIAKQMKIIHLEGYTEAERSAFRDVVHSNIVMCIKSLLQACENFELKLNKKNKVRLLSCAVFCLSMCSVSSFRKFFCPFNSSHFIGHEQPKYHL